MNLRLTLIRAAALAVFVGSITSMVGMPSPFAAPARATAPATTIPFTDVNPLGANFFLDREVEPWKRDLTVRMAKEAGIGWMKQMFPWEEIEPRRGYYFDDEFKVSTWKKYDEIVELANYHGLKIIARLDRPPAWTRSDNRYPTAPPDNLEDYGNFVHTVVSRYRGRVHYYQIWNEPNLWPEWGDRAVDPRGYREMLRVAYTRAKAADPSVVILSAPLGQTLENTSRNMSDLAYLDALYAAGASPFFDILAANGYGFAEPPQSPARADTLNFARLQLLRDVMVRNGDGHKPVWLNEFGWNASPADYPPQKLLWGRVTEQEQAAYTAEAIRMARQWGWVGVLNTWYFRQVGDIGIGRSDYFFRIVDVDFTPRRLFHELRGVAAEFAAAGPGRHTALHPALQPGPGWTEQPAPSGAGRLLAAPDRGGRITIRFHGTELTINTRGGHAPARIRATVEPRAALPALLGGGPFNVAIPTGAAAVAIVSGLSAADHTVTLEHTDGDPWALESFEVGTSGNPLGFWLALGAAAASAGVLVRSLRRRTAH